MTVQNRSLHFLPIPAEIAESARRTRLDAFGHSLAPTIASGPCRVCLKIPAAPTELILLSYQPLADRNPYAEIGPIFIHAYDCVPYADIERFPEDFRSRELVIRAYDADGNIHSAAVAPAGEGERTASAFLKDDTVAEVHVRHTTYTCFDFKIVRNPSAPATVSA